MSASKLDVFVAKQLLSEVAQRTDNLSCLVRNHLRIGGAWSGYDGAIGQITKDECLHSWATLSGLGCKLRDSIREYESGKVFNECNMSLMELEEEVKDHIELVNPRPPVSADAECVMCKKKAFGYSDNGLLECDECDADGLRDYEEAKKLNAMLRANIETLKAEGAQLRALIALSGEEKKTCAPSEEPKKKLWGDDPEVNDEVAADAALECPDIAPAVLESQSTCSAL